MESNNKKLTYSNYGSKIIISKRRDTRFASDRLHNAGPENHIQRILKAILDINQIAMQADIMSRAILGLGSDVYLKKVFGAERPDWARQLSECFVYDRVRCFFYAFFNTRIDSIPDVRCFKGHLALHKFVASQNITFTEGSDNTMSISTIVVTQEDFIEVLEELLNYWPNLRYGLSYKVGKPHWNNPILEGFLNGLYSEMTNIMSDKNVSQSTKDLMFEMTNLTNDSFMDQIVKESANPILNSYLSEDGKEFSFVNPPEISGDNSIKFNESVFLARAIGIRADELLIDSNQVYTKVPRNIDIDTMTRFEVHAITGIKSDLVPNTKEEMDRYLGFDTYSSSYDRKKFFLDKDGEETNTP